MINSLRLSRRLCSHITFACNKTILSSSFNHHPLPSTFFFSNTLSTKCSVLIPSSPSYILRTRTEKAPQPRKRKPKVKLIPKTENKEIEKNFVKVAVHYQEKIARFKFSVARTIESLVYDIKSHWKQLKEGEFDITDKEGSIWGSSTLLGDIPTRKARVELFLKVGEDDIVNREANEDGALEDGDESEDFEDGGDGQENENVIVNESKVRTPKIPFINQIVMEMLKEDSIKTVIEQDYERVLNENDITLLTNHFELWFYNQNNVSFSKDDSFEKIFADVKQPFVNFISEYSLQTLSYPMPTPLTPLLQTPNSVPKVKFAKPSLLNPQNWYPLARGMNRKIICHIGPTNSGKTYAALERLITADNGVYCGPLRLLAFEIFEKINAKKVPCSLLTGESQIPVPNANHVSCTIEMAETTVPVEVAVIDEYQQLGDMNRGWAWTRALLGIPAKEVHLCGDPSSLSIVQELCEMMGEQVEVKKYERLSPLIPLRKSLPGNPYESIEKGDCVIAFSRQNIYSIKREIERFGVHKCCVIYGALPPHTRREQAALFNDPQSGFDVVVASDAVGMGLNLNIKRIVFSTLRKFDGDRRRLLTSSEIKQIAGRAGRFGSIYPVGHVTCFEREDIPLVHRALREPYVDLGQVGLAPTFEQLEMFYLSDPKSSKNGLGYCMNRFSELAKLENLYFLCDHTEKTEVCDFLDPINLSLKERYLFCISPVDINNPLVKHYFFKYAFIYSSPHDAVPLLVDSLIDSDLRIHPAQLQKLESIHKVLDLYLWLSYRFEKFHERDRAEKLKYVVHTFISKILMSNNGRKRQFKKDKHQQRDRDDVDNLLEMETVILQNQ
eukprot:TRINITY_DN4408_c0_g1_i7.p1 TRINITY_DN4408_c0_g1~~TRINITY_DN4408_c0_g1_i7.p1  ORF type:complete len:839 (+),score=183.37 TRINITY_DN4408_c0_g1_i7:2355-4871(+)